MARHRAFAPRTELFVYFKPKATMAGWISFAFARSLSSTTLFVEEGGATDNRSHEASGLLAGEPTFPGTGPRLKESCAWYCFRCAKSWTCSGREHKRVSTATTRGAKAVHEQRFSHARAWHSSKQTLLSCRFSRSCQVARPLLCCCPGCGSHISADHTREC